MDEILLTLKKVLTKVKHILFRFYTKIIFIFNKQKTLQKIYEPITQSKETICKNLEKDLNQLKHKNKNLESDIYKLNEESSKLRHKISLFQELLINKNTP